MLTSTDLATKTQEKIPRKLKENIKTTEGNPLVSNPILGTKCVKIDVVVPLQNEEWGGIKYFHFF